MDPTGVDALEHALTQAMSARAQPVFDQRSVGRPESFSGKDIDWATWSFVTRPLLESIHDNVSLLMDHAESGTAADVVLKGMTEENKGIARKIYLLLVPGCKGKSLAVCKRVERNNGFALWRELVLEYEPIAAGRHTSMLVGLLSPDAWQKKEGNDFMDALRDWETLVTDYERKSQEKLSSNIRIAVILRHAPADIKNALRMSLGAVAGNYDKLKLVIEEYCVSGRDFDQRGVLAPTDPNGPAPLEVGGVARDGKGG